MTEREPSKKTFQLISKIKENCAKEHTSIELMNQKLEGVEKTQEKILEKINNLDTKLDKKYAGKWTEKAVVGFIVAMAVSALYFILEAVGLPHP
jgi:hypothetical protein